MKKTFEKAELEVVAFGGIFTPAGAADSFSTCPTEAAVTSNP